MTVEALLCMGRPSKGSYFMRIATEVATRATCNRANVGCVLVRNNRIISTGYNGSAPGLPHCDDVGHDLDAGHCARVIHAEENAIIQAALFGVSTDGAICYCTHHPCYRCAARLFSAGIREIVWLHAHASESATDRQRIEQLQKAGLVLHKIILDEDV